MNDRNRRALILLAVVAVPTLIWYFMTDDPASAVVAPASENIPAVERRLDRYRQIAATVPVKEVALAAVRKELAQREAGLIVADTASQAQAQLSQIVRKIARAQATPIDLRAIEIGPVKTFDAHYGEISLGVTFDAGIEQLANFLAELTAQKEIIGTSDIRIGSANPKQKTMPVRLTVAALVRKDLVPEKKGPSF